MINLAYALMYDTCYNSVEISGLYRSLKGAMEAVPNSDWKKHETLAMWESLTGDQYWCITVHAVLD